MNGGSAVGSGGSSSKAASARFLVVMVSNSTGRISSTELDIR